MTPTSRSLEHLRRLGYLAAVVECWIPKINRRRDLWHFADILAVHPRDGLFLLVQTTSLSNVPSRLAKAKARPELAAWLKAGGSFEVHGWTRRGDGPKVKIVSVRADELQTCILQAPPRKQRGERQRTLFG